MPCWRPLDVQGKGKTSVSARIGRSSLARFLRLCGASCGLVETAGELPIGEVEVIASNVLSITLS